MYILHGEYLSKAFPEALKIHLYFKPYILDICLLHYFLFDYHISVDLLSCSKYNICNSVTPSGYHLDFLCFIARFFICVDGKHCFLLFVIIFKFFANRILAMIEQNNALNEHQ